GPDLGETVDAPALAGEAAVQLRHAMPRRLPLARREHAVAPVGVGAGQCGGPLFGTNLPDAFDRIFVSWDVDVWHRASSWPVRRMGSPLAAAHRRSTGRRNASG